MIPDGIVVIGAGGHAKVCIELLRAMGEEVAWCVGAADSPEECLGVRVLRGDEHLASLRADGATRLFVAIGSNAARERLGAHALSLGYELVSAISPTAVVSPSARVGSGVAIMAGATINAEARIGDLAIINTSASVDHDCDIGRAVHIAPQSGLAGNVTVGARTFVGVGASIIPDIDIGADVVVGAGATVIRNVPLGATVVGVPARPLEPEERGG